MHTTDWPNPSDLDAVCRLLCRPSPVRVRASKLESARGLAELEPGVPGTAPGHGTMARLRSHLVEWRSKTQGGILTFYDAAYPALLRHIAYPPVVLFCVGDTRWLGSQAVALVGSRAASKSACRWTQETAADLARLGLVVASGFARGIDAAAHQGALDAGGATVAVLGTGPDVCYPPEHRDLGRRIQEHGCLVTELPPGTPPLPHHFPMRNRILSGIVSGVVVVQAEKRSGALITARQALEENREVMAVPGAVEDPRSLGPHRLLREGAVLVEGARDILEVLGGFDRARSCGRSQTQTDPEPHESETEQFLVRLGSGALPEILRKRLGWDADRLQRVLTTLELAGVVRVRPGGRVEPVH